METTNKNHNIQHFYIINLIFFINIFFFMLAEHFFYHENNLNGRLSFTSLR